MSTRQNQIIVFGSYRLDTENQELRHGERVVELQPKPLAVLQYLAQRPGVVVSNQDLLRNMESITKWGLRKSGCQTLNCLLGCEPMSSQETAPAIYQFRVWLRGISPTIWRRVLVRSDSTIVDLHYILQLVMG